MPRYAARVDANQPEVTKTLRGAGFHVNLLHFVGKGHPDMVVTGYHRGLDTVAALYVELKTDDGTLTDDEARWHDEYPAGGPLIVARSADDVLRWFGAAE